MGTRAGDQRRDQVVVIGMLDAQVVFGLGERHRLGSRRNKEDGGHGGLSESAPHPEEQPRN
jgi:hypothetical protein